MAIKRKRAKLPADTEQMNEQRAEWARLALGAFMSATGQTDAEESLGDLLCDLMHLCDRSELDFLPLVNKACRMYLEETNA